ncbi:MAG: glycosyltransferase family 4 protein [Candidatus Edwardsbacteria bacterium]
MRICYLGDITSIHLQRWAAHFRKNDNEIYIISVQKGKIEGATLYFLELIKWQKEKNLFKKVIGLIIIALRIRWWLWKIRPEIVHLHYLYTDLSILACLPTKNLLISCFGTDLIPLNHKEKVWRKWVRRILLRSAKIIIVDSKFLADYLHQYSYLKDKVITIPLGVDLDFFKPINWQRKRSSLIRLCVTKQLEVKYGHQFLLQALRQVVEKFPHLKLLICNEGSEENSLKALTEKLNLSNYVEFLGWLSEEKIRDCLAESDIFVLPSLRESFPVSVMEAMSMELPVIATRVGSVPELVLHGKTGILIKPKDVTELREAISKLIKNPELRMIMGKQGRRLVEEKYDCQDCLRKLKTLYEMISHRA